MGGSRAFIIPLAEVADSAVIGVAIHQGLTLASLNTMIVPLKTGLSSSTGSQQQQPFNQPGPPAPQFSPQQAYLTSQRGSAFQCGFSCRGAILRPLPLAVQTACRKSIHFQAKTLQAGSWLKFVKWRHDVVLLDDDATFNHKVKALFPESSSTLKCPKTLHLPYRARLNLTDMMQTLVSCNYSGRTNLLRDLFHHSLAWSLKINLKRICPRVLMQDSKCE